ncbi:hypothetical protein NDN08_000373 [Rhodosorus marinus]|uniref:Protein SirB1 N-terminal domain-containing protein n=1 Tax=Rhodosorus marinus TaxID=101924 RepID=A0AAV8UMR0_9RHOD|nr:hypothetical protein NDN08_000373 [Rhodosorus marinus]
MEIALSFLQGFGDVNSGRKQQVSRCKSVRRRRKFVVAASSIDDELGMEQKQRFYESVVAVEGDLQLFEALMCISDGEKKRIDLDYHRNQMDAWSRELSSLVRKDNGDPFRQLGVVNQFFFDELGFRLAGNDDFYNPDNSLIDEVMRTRIGIPISLCAIYRELCHRATDLRLEGINFPAHFLLRLRSPHIYIDPAQPEKALLRRSDLQGMLDKYFPDQPVALSEDMLRVVDEKEIVIRVLRNLKTAYLKANQNEEALSVMDRLVLISPTTAGERRDRGLLLHIMGRRKRCVQDLEFFVALEKNNPDSVVLRALISRYRNQPDEQ